MIDCIIGIDPGVTGCLAVRFMGTSRTYKMSKDITKVNDLLIHYKNISDSILVIIEMIRLHRTENIAIANRMQKLYGNYKELLALVMINDIPYAEAGPTTWQSFLNLNSKAIKKLERDQRKKAYRDFAQNWWPEKIPIYQGDAVCLVIYGERNVKFNPEFGVISKGVQKLI